MARAERRTAGGVAGRIPVGGGLDWPALMRVGLHGLGLRPAEFWALSPMELAVMLGEVAGTRPLTRARLSELAAQWPDRGPGKAP